MVYAWNHRMHHWLLCIRIELGQYKVSMPCCMHVQKLQKYTQICWTKMCLKSKWWDIFRPLWATMWIHIDSLSINLWALITNWTLSLSLWQLSGGLNTKNIFTTTCSSCSTSIPNQKFVFKRRVIVFKLSMWEYVTKWKTKIF